MCTHAVCSQEDVTAPDDPCEPHHRTHSFPFGEPDADDCIPATHTEDNLQNAKPSTAATVSSLSHTTTSSMEHVTYLPDRHTCATSANESQSSPPQSQPLANSPLSSSPLFTRVPVAPATRRTKTPLPSLDTLPHSLHKLTTSHEAACVAHHHLSSSNSSASSTPSEQTSSPCASTASVSTTCAHPVEGGSTITDTTSTSTSTRMEMEAVVNDADGLCVIGLKRHTRTVVECAAPTCHVRQASGGSSSPATAHVPQASPTTATLDSIERVPKLPKRVLRWSRMLQDVMRAESTCETRVADVCRRIAASIGGNEHEAKDTFLTLLVHLRDPENHLLRRRVLSGEIAVETLMQMPEHDLVNPERRRKMDLVFEERARDRNLTEMASALQTTSRLFPCPSCKVRDCSWVQRQTRSGDEPMTIFCTCNKCGTVWKRY